MLSVDLVSAKSRQRPTLEMRVLSTVHGVSSFLELASFAANWAGPLPGRNSSTLPELRSHLVAHSPHLNGVRVRVSSRGWGQG